jgi:cell wall-associated NlpC family hydrolase
MKKILTIAAMTMTLTTCGITAGAVTPTGEVIQESNNESFLDVLIELKEAEQADLRAEVMQSRIQSLYPHIGSTWYVFSGVTPEGWDCSGMVMWFYLELGIELEHSVTAQIHSGRNVTEPLPGDIVSFRHNGSNFGYHNGLYLGNDLFAHAPKVGDITKVSLVSKYAGDHSEVVYTRIGIRVIE